MTIAVAQPRVKAAITYSTGSTNWLIGAAEGGHISVIDAYAEDERFAAWVVTDDGTFARYGIFHFEGTDPYHLELDVWIAGPTGGFSDEETGYVSVGPAPFTPEFSGFVASDTISVPTSVSFTTVSSWDASHDPLGAWSSTYWAIPDFVGAVRASFKVRCGAVADATSFTARISWDTGATYDQVVWAAYEGETVYLVTPIKAVASGWDRVQFQIVHDDTGAVSFDVEASIEVWPG